MSMRMLRIEVRRSMAVWVLPILVVSAALEANNTLLQRRVLLWPDISAMVGDLIVFLGPLVGGVAAWIAGRDSRRGMGELLDTTPRPAMVRKLHIWGAATTWGVVAYVIVGTGLLAYSFVRDAWGTPDVPDLLLGLLATPAYAALGFALGVWAPGRFTAPLTAILLFAVQVYLSGFLSAQESAAAYLLPVLDYEGSIWYIERRDLALSRAIMLIGLTGVGLGAVALKGRRNIAPWAVCTAALVLTLTGAGLTLHNAPANGAETFPSSSSDTTSGYKLIPYEPRCRSAAIQVCVHPAFEPMLSDLVGIVNGLAGPLVGVSGVPRRIEQVSPNAPLPMPPGTIYLSLIGHPSELEYLRYIVASNLARNHDATQHRQTVDRSSAQDALEVWLLRQAGVQTQCVDFDQGGARGRVWTGTAKEYDVSACEAAERFAKLDPAKRKRWLAENYMALRAGQIGLEDLP